MSTRPIGQIDVQGVEWWRMEEVRRGEGGRDVDADDLRNGVRPRLLKYGAGSGRDG